MLGVQHVRAAERHSRGRRHRPVGTGGGKGEAGPQRQAVGGRADAAQHRLCRGALVARAGQRIGDEEIAVAVLEAAEHLLAHLHQLLVGDVDGLFGTGGRGGQVGLSL